MIRPLTRTPDSPAGANTRAAVVSFLVAAAALFAQVLVHRLVSAKLLNNYAFLVISLTMLGFAVAGVVLTRALPAVLARRDEYLAAFGALFALTLLATSAIFSYLPAGAQFTTEPAVFITTLLTWLPAALLFAVPFGFAGLILGALLSDPRLPARLVYGADLLGSALGAIIVIPAIRHLGVERSLVLCAAVTLIGMLAANWPRQAMTRALSVAAVAAIVLAGARPQVVFPIKVRSGSQFVGRGNDDRMGIEYVQWDPVARIEISRIPRPHPGLTDYPLLIGDQAPFLERFRRVLTQNDYAFSFMVDYDGRRESLNGIGDTIYAAAYHATSVPRPRVVAIGVGGGFDLLTALYFDASHVTGVEVNGATLDILRRVYADYFRSWVTDPRVTLVEDDGRHFLAASGERYDVIQLSGVDSYSGTPGAAHVFSENYLYTAEAFDLYLSRLTDEGILNMMRLEFIPPREMLRALVSAVGALRRAGVEDPARHIIMLTARPKDNFTALLVKKTPFSAEQQAKVRAWAGAARFFYLSAAPGDDANRANLYQLFLSLGDPARERSFVHAYPYDVAPATDDRPFFFNFSFWSHLLAGDARKWPPMQVTVLLLMALVGVAAVVCVYLPLRFMATVERPAASWRATLYFAAIAVGYMAVEIALLQKFGVFLGHPNYALSVVLAALLLSTGAGALASGALVRALGRLRFVSYALAFVLLAAHLVVFPRLLGWVGLPFAVRAAVVFALIAPLGMLLGIFMPWGLDRLKQTHPALAPWAWGINGIFSVLAPVVSVAFAMSWGSGALMLTAIPAYLAAAFALDRDPAVRPPVV
jgi:spermidine synthase